MNGKPYRPSPTHATVAAMKNTADDSWLAGVDGCPAGWLVAFGRPNGEVRAPRVFAHFADIVTSAERPAIIAIDVPIGLPAHSPAGGRLAELVVPA